MYNISFDIASIVLYLIVGLYYLQRKHIKGEQHTLLGVLVLCVTCFSVFDILGSISIEKAFPVALVYIFNELYYIAECIFSYALVLYVLAHLELPGKKIKKHRVAISIPVIVLLVIIVTNVFTGFIFSYDTVNGWQYGTLRSLIYIEYLFYFFWAALYVTVKRKELMVHFTARVHTIAFLNIIPTVLQFFIQGQLMKPYFAGLSILILWFEELSNDAKIDMDTGLSNYAYMCQTIKRMIYNKMPFRVILVRIGDYDLLNTSYGIENTDKLADSVARYLSHWVPSGSSFKYGSSAFALIFQEDDIEELEKKVYTGLNHVWHIDELDMTPSFFVTGLPYPEHITDLDDFIAHASYFQKMHRMRYGIVPEEELHVRDRVHEARIVNALRNGLENGDFYVHYQPIYDTESGKFVTAEVLARLNDPELGNIPPMEFIPLAEENGMIIRLGYKVIEEVCSFIHDNDMEALGLEYIELNLSVVQCLQRDFIDNIMKIVRKYDVSTSQLCLEITETASNCAPEIFTKNLNELKSLGFLLALDDYGTGYANLERMVQNDFDFIKFDKEMIQRTLSKKKLLGLYFRLQTVFHSMGCKIVAEGVETKSNFDVLNGSGCDYVQGYYFSKPIAKDKFVEFLMEKNK